MTEIDKPQQAYSRCKNCKTLMLWPSGTLAPVDSEDVEAHDALSPFTCKHCPSDIPVPSSFEEFNAIRWGKDLPEGWWGKQYMSGIPSDDRHLLFAVLIVLPGFDPPSDGHVLVHAQIERGPGSYREMYEALRSAYAGASRMAAELAAEAQS